MARAKYEVIGEFPVEERDEDGKWVRDVRPGGVVTLDDERTNIRALVETGVVRPYEPPEPEKTPAKTPAKTDTKG